MNFFDESSDKTFVMLNLKLDAKETVSPRYICGTLDFFEGNFVDWLGDHWLGLRLKKLPEHVHCHEPVVSPLE